MKKIMLFMSLSIGLYSCSDTSSDYVIYKFNEGSGSYTITYDNNGAIVQETVTGGSSLDFTVPYNAKVYVSCFDNDFKSMKLSVTANGVLYKEAYGTSITYEYVNNQ